MILEVCVHQFWLSSLKGWVGGVRAGREVAKNPK